MLQETVRKFALQNAVLYGGEAQVKAVVGKVLASQPALRERAAEVARVAETQVAEVNRMELEAQRRLLEELAPELLEPRPGKGPTGLPDLPAVGDQVVMRLAPYPSGPLHIGNARMVLLNDAYVRRYGGRLLLVHDDTIGSEEKLPVAEAYDLVEAGLEWLEVEVAEVLYKSDRLDLFYDWGRRLLEAKAAYVCRCRPETLRRHRAEGRACEHRGVGQGENLAQWDRMLRGEFGEGEAIVRLKTSMTHPDPAFRDRVLFRISHREHPRVGTRYTVWPLLELSWAVDDHVLGITHVLRGKDLVMEDEMERAIWAVLGVEGPHFLHYGRLRLKDATLSKSAQRRLIEAGTLAGPDDPRTWSLQSLERRGIQPEALRQFILGFGLSLTDIEVPAETLYTENRRLIDPVADRYFFVPDPVQVTLRGLPEVRDAQIPLHPDFPDRGKRIVPGASLVYLPEADVAAHRGEEIRLKDWCNVRLEDGARFVSWRVKDVPKVQWLPEGLPTEVLMPDGTTTVGLGEGALGELPPGTIVQLERFGFARRERGSDPLPFAFAHR